MILHDAKIGIIGVGIVGNAIMKSLLNKGYHRDYNLFCYDKYKDGFDSLTSVLCTQIVFLALPTKFNTTTKQYNIDAIDNTCQILQKNFYNGIIVLKSTVEPKTTQYLAKKYKLNIVHNPEFLTANNAESDFENQKHIIIGALPTTQNIELLLDFYKQHYPLAKITLCQAIESESMKIFENSFCATKVQFFNELYLLCQKMEVNYDNIKMLMINNNKISHHHTNVPGPDGQHSYGGFCFPKDTIALLQFMKKYQTPCAILEASIQERNDMRSDNINIQN